MRAVTCRIEVPDAEREIDGIDVVECSGEKGQVERQEDQRGCDRESLRASRNHGPGWGGGVLTVIGVGNHSDRLQRSPSFRLPVR